ncbi:ParB/RepB/Spo0J family partition protein [Pseudahrensia aquimaris]|uniref:ParB/RepB/Spo0J family partition protein n=1 Tax=Pseudahrensia aquimaris TaxID=744461 RepID=A0ABW3FE18_9HYPH
MAKDASNKRLGKGLAALIGDMDRSPAPPAVAVDDPDLSALVKYDRSVPIEQVTNNANNPRRQFRVSELEELANSIAEHGIVQPILVRPKGQNRYEVIAGERRWRAAQKAGLHEVPVVIRDVDDREALELAIIENVQRSDLNPIEEALGYQQLIDDHKYKQADLGKVIGKSRSHVANTLRLLKLPVNVRSMLSEGSLSSGHARALITLDNPESLAKRVVAEGLSVRETEMLAARGDIDSDSKQKPKPVKDADTRALESSISDALGMKVSITHRPNGKGRLMIDYKSLEQLDSLAERLKK